MMDAFIFVACLALAAPPEAPTVEAKPRFTIGKETTYIEKPLDAAGRVDYAAALNERLGKGITAKTNANVLIWQAIGPKPEGGNGMPPEYFKLLGIEPPPEKGDYLVTFHKFYRALHNVQAGPDLQPADDAYDRATSKPWTAGAEPDVAAWLKAIDAPLALAVEATKRPDYFSPLVPTKKGDKTNGLISCLLPGVQKCREIAAALSARAMMKIGDGDSAGAWADLQACHRLGRLVARGGTLIEYLVGVAIDTIACRGEIHWLDKAKADKATLEKCAKDLQELPPMPDLAGKVDLTERFMYLDSMMRLDEDGVQFLRGAAGGDAGFFERIMFQSVQWDPALKLANVWYDKAVAALKLPTRMERVKKLEDFELELVRMKNKRKAAGAAGIIWENFTGAKGQSEAIGEILLGLLMPAIRKVADAEDRFRQTNENVRLAFALARYRADEGRYPETLNALVPKYVKAVPSDIFSGKPLNFQSTADGFLLYSIGANGKDEKGQSNVDEPRGDDLPVRLPAKK